MLVPGLAALWIGVGRDPGEARPSAAQPPADTAVLYGPVTFATPTGGAVGVYQVQRRKPGGSWEDVATSMDAIELLRDQPRGVDLEYRVLALNRAGAGSPSGTVTAVL